MSKKNRSFWNSTLKTKTTTLYVLLLLILSALIVRFLSPLLGIFAIIIGGYFIITYRKHRQELETAERIQTLKNDIRQADTGIKQLEQLKKDNDGEQYLATAKKVLSKLRRIQNETKQLQSKIDTNIYKRITKHAKESKKDISEQVKYYKSQFDETSVNDLETIVKKQAPELLKTYRNIQKDHKTILEKLKKADNKEEFLALHQTSMDRFDDILQGYLKIKTSPKDYYNADERLNQAKEALEQFDLDLDETLRRLNESDMTDFDVSLRMMHDKL